MATDSETNGPRTWKPTRRTDGPEPDNQSLQTAEEEIGDVERDIPEASDEPVERDADAEKPDPPIFEE